MEAWQTKPIGELFRVVNGGTPKTSVADYWDGHHYWITPAEMGGLSSPYLSESRRRLTDEGLRVGAELVPANSIILSTRAPIGHLVINEVPMAFNQGCKGLVPLTGIDTKFAYFFLLAIVPLLDSLGTGATFRELSGGKLKEVPIRFPALPEQRRIVAILDEAFEGIATAKANAEKNLRNARELFDGYLDAAFGQLESTEPIEKLGKLCEFEGGSQPPKSEFVYAPRSGYVRFLQIRDFGTDRHETYIPDAKKNRLCNESDILIGRYGASVGKILTGKAGAYNVALMKTVPNQSLLDPDFFHRYLTSGAFQSRLMNVAARSAQDGFSKDDIFDFPVPRPLLAKQQAIVEQIDPVHEESQRLAAIYERKVAALDELKKSLLHQAFNGALTAKSTDKQMADVA